MIHVLALLATLIASFTDLTPSGLNTMTRLLEKTPTIERQKR